MKTIIFILMVLLSAPVMAEIPGFLELDTNMSFYSTGGSERFINYNQFDIKFKYGIEFRYASPYIFYEYENNFKSQSLMHNYPFRDEYITGLGILFINTFYIELSHVCSHQVYSHAIENNQERYYNQLTKYTHNVITIGAKFRID